MKAILEGGLADGTALDGIPMPPRAVLSHVPERVLKDVRAVTPTETYDLVTNEWGDPERDAFGRVRYRVRLPLNAERRPHSEERGR